MPLRFVAFLSFALCTWAQAPRPGFEVTVVRPVDKTKPNINSGIRTTVLRPDVDERPDRKSLRPHDRPGRRPGWSAEMRATSFDIEAKLPPGAAPSQFPSMVRELLEERFKLVAHRATKVTDFMAVTVAKGGIKFEKVDRDPSDFSMFDWANSPELFQSGSTKTMEGADGITRVQMSTLADVATLLLPYYGGLPVVDKTGLQGAYDLRLQYPMPDTRKAAAEGRVTAEFVSDVREQMRTGKIKGIEKLGLKIEKQRGEVDILVIDHLEKVLTEN